ncbi:hypothetical protein P7C70_g7236, partial [Phenoliferia sp. Uapishka_3]
MRFHLALSALLLPLASASLFITSPTAKSSISALKNTTITWISDAVRAFRSHHFDFADHSSPPAKSTTPVSSQFGEISVGLYTGSSTDQTLLQNFGNVLDPMKTLKLEVQLDRTVGPNSSLYFIRMQSLKGTDSASGSPLQAFSARFTLTGMNGTFTKAEIAQNAGITALSSIVSNSSYPISKGSSIKSSAGGIQTASSSSATAGSISGGLASGTEAVASGATRRGDSKRVAVAVFVAAGGFLKGQPHQRIITPPGKMYFGSNRPSILVVACVIASAVETQASTPHDDPDFFNSVGDEDFYEPYDHDLEGKDAEHRLYGELYERAIVEEDLAEQDRVLRAGIGAEAGSKEGRESGWSLSDGAHTKGPVILAFITLASMAGLAAWLKRKKTVRKNEGVPPTPDMRAHQGEAARTLTGAGSRKRAAKENHFNAPTTN